MKMPYGPIIAAIVYLIGLGCVPKATTQITSTDLRLAHQPTLYPHATLNNGVLALSCYLPDPTVGYYRSSRFDCSGMVYRVQYHGHTIFGERKADHSPTGSDDILGLAEEFDIERPPGYIEAETGEPFLKIGVGILQRLTNEPYHFFTTYPILQPCLWTTNTTNTTIRFKTSMSDGHGHGYYYIKQLELMPDKPEFTISRTLTNTGTDTLSTEHYCHHFVLLDDAPIGPQYGVTFDRPVYSLPNATLSPARINQTMVDFEQEILPHRSVWAQLASPSTVPARAIVKNNRTHIQIDIEPNYSPSKWVLYAERWAVCPEVFCQINLKPGQSAIWTTRYRIH